jgi:hypothetical protein
VAWRQTNSAASVPIAALAFLLLLFFGAIILAIIKVVIFILLSASVLGLAGLTGYGCWRFSRRLWNRQLNIEAFVPAIDWTFPSFPKVVASWTQRAGR